MAHLVRILTDAALKRGLVVTGQNLADIDQNTVLGINGDGGGTWSPAAAVEINGAKIPNGGPCVTVAGPWTISGAGVTVTTASNKFITFAKGDATDYFGFAVAHPNAAPSVFVDFQGGDSSLAHQVFWLTAGLIAIAPGARFFTPLPVYVGAPKIDSVTVDFNVSSTHANVPQTLPRMRVIAVAADGTVTPLRAPDATTDTDGFQAFPTPASGAAWYALGVLQSWVYTCNVALPVDDAHLYFVEFIEESGANSWTVSGTNFRSATVAYSNVAIFDGRN